LRTVHEPTRLKLSADRSLIRADGQDLSYITIEVTDVKDILHPKADPLIRFEIEGPGSIVAVGSANPMSTESFQQPQRKAWHGRCLAVVKSTQKAGRIIFTASAEGLKPARIVIDSK
jgi:beta-galactosidase